MIDIKEDKDYSPKRLNWTDLKPGDIFKVADDLKVTDRFDFKEFYLFLSQDPKADGKYSFIRLRDARIFYDSYSQPQLNSFIRYIPVGVWLVREDT